MMESRFLLLFFKVFYLFIYVSSLIISRCSVFIVSVSVSYAFDQDLELVCFFLFFLLSIIVRLLRVSVLNGQSVDLRNCFMWDEYLYIWLCLRSDLMFWIFGFFTKEYASVVKPKEQVLAGRMHHLTPEIIESWKKKLYEAKVSVLNFKEFQEAPMISD